MRLLLLGLLFIAVPAYSKVYFEETFSDGDAWESRWVQSAHEGKEFGKFILTAGEFYGDAEADKGLKSTQDARFYGLSAKFDPFNNQDKPLVVQFTVKHEQKIDCGGGYLKLFDCSMDQKQMHGESPYSIMFGPDICGPGTKKVHVIFNYKGTNLLIKKDITCKDDVFSHLYTLILKPDNTYEVLIDNEKAESGSLEDDWEFLQPKKIKDPEANKPNDWEDKATIPDPDDKKPEDWDKPEHIPDPDATKQEDWDDEMDGEWEPPVINNPEYKGEWKPKEIDNANYKGPWVHPEIDNPDYSPDDKLYMQKEICTVGLDLWQVKSGTIFDNFFIGDDVKEAKEIGDKTWGATKDAMKAMKDKQDEEERKKAEEEAKANESVDKIDEEDNEDLDDVDEENEHDEL